MYIITDKDDTIISISKTVDYQENGNVLVDDEKNGKYAIAKPIFKEVYEVEEVQAEIETNKYCYTKNQEFYKNDNYIEYYTEEQRISALEDAVNMLLGF